MVGGVWGKKKFVGAGQEKQPKRPTFFGVKLSRKPGLSRLFIPMRQAQNG
jgi:hypothetical protein